MISGQVKDENNIPIANATLQMLPFEWFAISDANGRYVFDRVMPGNYTLQVTMVGYVSFAKEITVKEAAQKIEIVLNARIAGLEEVTVVARSMRVGSSSRIDKMAIIHTQPTSLFDALQLIPGQLAQNPNLGAPQQINLRQIPSTTDAGRANALGTQIVLDGVPQSNNANLQTNLTILNSGPTTLPPFASVAGRGNDLRQIPADNIESIEVVRGIPSARFGDLTSGLIMVNSRLGTLKPQVTMRLNPNLVQASLLYGKTTQSKKHGFNLGADILQSRDDIRDIQNRYSRVQGQLSWQTYWGANRKFVTTTIANGYTTIDKLMQDPGDLRSQTKRNSQDRSLRISTEGRWKAGKPWLHQLHYLFSYTNTYQNSYFQEIVTRDLFPLSTATTDTTMPGQYGRSEYLSQTTVNGRPRNAYARVEYAILKKTGSFNHNILLGTEWRMDENNGTGRMFNVIEPPRQNYSVGDRPRNFNDVPALHQLGYYLEDRLNGKIGNKRVLAQMGVRVDNVAPVGIFSSKYNTLVSPRLNVSTEVSKGLWLRAGYGHASKAVPLNFLYPGQRFFDLVNFNYFATNPAERLVIVTTRVIDLDDQRINPYISKKWEAGFDIEKNKWNINASIFHENTTGAPGNNRLVQPFSFHRLRAQSTPTGQPPILDPIPVSTDTFFAAYDAPANNRRIINTGIEYNIDFPEISAIRTRINLNGAFIKTDSYDDGVWYDAAKAYLGTTVPQRIGMYQSSARVQADRLNTSIRFIHHIPRLNIIFSALWQTVWISSSRNVPLDSLPIGFVNRRGEITLLSLEQAKQPGFSDLIRPVNQGTTNSFPPLHLFNIRFTKEWKKGIGCSFYANNFLGNRPLHRNNITDVNVRRNEPLFFGAELTVRF
jgi:outer membrane receptor for ferrienterochelin and colicin